MKKNLAESNRYLRSTVERERGQWQAAKSSSAIEGIRAPFNAGPDAPRPATTSELLAHVKLRLAKRDGSRARTSK
ncbi:MAG: hypothetical protein ACRESS_06950 [Stenotrophobium sp.]